MAGGAPDIQSSRANESLQQTSPEAVLSTGKWRLKGFSRAQAALALQLQGNSSCARQRGEVLMGRAHICSESGKCHSFCLRTVRLPRFQSFPREDTNVTGRLSPAAGSHSYEELMVHMGQSPAAAGSDRPKLPPLWGGDHLLLSCS